MTVIFRTCNNSFEAELIKGRLEAEGINCILQGQNINAIYGGIGALAINVLIDDSNLERANEIMEE